MELIKAKREDYEAIEQIYLEAFPDNERAPWEWLAERVNRSAKLFKAEDDGQLVGFFYVVEHPKKQLAYLFYFAVDKNLRHVGYGSEMLKRLKELYMGWNVFLAREQIDETAENHVQREKRRDFYLKNGFKDLDIQVREGNVLFDLMGTRQEVKEKDYLKLMDFWAGEEGFLNGLVEFIKEEG